MGSKRRRRTAHRRGFVCGSATGPHIFNLLLLAGGGILILLNARFYASLRPSVEELTRWRRFRSTYYSFFTVESPSSLRYVATCSSALRIIFIFGPLSPTVGAQVPQAEYCSSSATPPQR